MKKIFNVLKTGAHYVLALSAGLIGGGVVSSAAYVIGGITAPAIGAIAGSMASFGMIVQFVRAYKSPLPRGAAAGYTTALAMCVVGNCAGGIHQDNKLWKEELSGGKDITSSFNETHKKTVKKPSTAPSRRPQLQN